MKYVHPEFTACKNNRERCIGNLVIISLLVILALSIMFVPEGKKIKTKQIPEVQKMRDEVIEKGKFLSEVALGDSESKRLIMKADDALDKKLQSYIKIQEIYADELSKKEMGPEPFITDHEESYITDFNVQK